VDDVVVSSLSGIVEIFPNTGAGGLGTPVIKNLGIPINTGVVLAPLGPFGTPGKTEILVPDPTTNSFLVIQNASTTPGTVVLGTTLKFAMDNGPYALAVAPTPALGSFPANPDMNGDGIPDVVTANTGVNIAGGPSLTGQSFSVARGKTTAAGKIDFLEAQVTQEAAYAAPAAVTVGDVNGDGIPDYVVADSGQNPISKKYFVEDLYHGQPPGADTRRRRLLDQDRRRTHAGDLRQRQRVQRDARRRRYHGHHPHQRHDRRQAGRRPRGVAQRPRQRPD
jgi:hypothetical protein